MIAMRLFWHPPAQQLETVQGPNLSKTFVHVPVNPVLVLVPAMYNVVPELTYIQSPPDAPERDSVAASCRNAPVTADPFTTKSNGPDGTGPNVPQYLFAGVEALDPSPSTLPSEIEFGESLFSNVPLSVAPFAVAATLKMPPVIAKVPVEAV